MLGMITNLLGGGIVGTIAKQINVAYQNKLNAKNAKERIEADKLIAELEARRAVLVAEQGHWMTRWIRPAFALPFVIFNFKVVVWDKVLGWGVTDDLSAEFWQLQMIVFGCYFLTRPIEKYFRRK